MGNLLPRILLLDSTNRRKHLTEGVTFRRFFECRFPTFLMYWSPAPLRSGCMCQLQVLAHANNTHARCPPRSNRWLEYCSAHLFEHSTQLSSDYRLTTVWLSAHAHTHKPTHPNHMFVQYMWSSWLGRWPPDPKVAGSIPTEDHMEICDSIPG